MRNPTGNKQLKLKKTEILKLLTRENGMVKTTVSRYCPFKENVEEIRQPEPEAEHNDSLERGKV